MSRDFQLAWPCPHLTVEEYVTLDSDRRSLVTKQPIVNAGLVRVLVNNEVFIPQSGLYSQATLMATVSGPYDVLPGEDTLTITTSSGMWSYTFGVRSTTRYSGEQVVQLLQRANVDIAFVGVENGHLMFVDTATVGPSSFVEVSGSAAASLGFGKAGVNARQRRDRGLQLFPSWELHTTTSSRYPKFRSPLRGNPVLKVTYTTSRERCRRCGGGGVENDLRFDASGQTLMIENEDLLVQAALKILLTERGSNPYHPWYGTDLKSRLGSKAVSGVSTLITEDVRRALGKLQSLQTAQAQAGQVVSFKERLYNILAVKVSPHQQDQTAFLVDVTVQNASNEPVTVSIVYAAPQTVALMGTNGLMLGTETAGLTTGRL